MIKEPKSVRNPSSFKMIPRPSGANILESTWEFKKERYLDGDLKEFKTQFV